MTHSLAYRRILYRMGYYNYQQGLLSHHLNQEGGWNSHLRKCRDFIMRSFDIVRPSIVTVLGSGWLLDLPLAEMAEQADQVNLVDIVHPPEVRTQTSKQKNVIIREEDVTGGLIRELWEKAGHRTFLNRLKTLNNISVPEYKPDFNPGLIISLNILTQLDSMPLRLLKKKTVAGDNEILALRKKIQESHLALLGRHPSVLITDLAEVVTGSSGEENEIPSVLVTIPGGRVREEWTWDFDLRRSDFYTKRSIYKIAAVLLF